MLFNVVLDHLRDFNQVLKSAIHLAKNRGRQEIGPDELLLSCLEACSQFGVASIGPWAIDLEALGVDWIAVPPQGALKVAYSEDAVKVFDRAVAIARSEAVNVTHMLAAFAAEETGLMGELKRAHGIDSAGWRMAICKLVPGIVPESASSSEYLTPEQAAEALGIHVQTLRAYVRGGKLPAMRLAGERAIRIRRADLEKVLEPVVPEIQVPEIQ